MVAADAPGRLHALQPEVRRHADVRQHDVREMFVHRRQQRVAVVHRGDQFEVLDRSEERGSTLSHEIVVLSEHDPQRHAGIVHTGSKAGA